MLSNKFDSWIEPESSVKVYRITDGHVPIIHRFYDTSPISPSGRYIALIEFPYDDHLPLSGDQARVFVLDLTTAEEVYSSYTAAWDTQVGAHVQWGPTDDALYFNRMDIATWVPYGVKVNIFEGSELRLDFTIYMVAPDGRRAMSPCLRRIGLAQPGYGVVIPEQRQIRNDGASSEDGLYSVDTETGRSTLVCSFADLFAQVGVNPQAPNNGAYYGFHVKWNPIGDRIIFIVRYRPEKSGVGKTQNFLFTMDADGSQASLALPPEQWEGGHHPNWCPDGHSIVMNLLFPRPAEWRVRSSAFLVRAARKAGLSYFPKSRRLTFVRIAGRGGNIEVIAPGVLGSGHPSIDPSGRVMISDAYPNEQVAFKDGSVPIRAIDIANGIESCLVRVDTKPKYVGPHSEYRIDPHPAWTKDGSFVTFNGSVAGCRSVFVADMSSVTGNCGLSS